MTDMPSIIEYSRSLADQEQPKPLPARDYRAEVRGAEIHKSKTSGKNSLKLTFWIAPTEYPVDFASEGSPDGTTLDLYRSIEDTPMSRWMMRGTCEALGVPLSNRIDPTTFHGREAMVTVEHEEYEGRQQARLKTVRPL